MSIDVFDIMWGNVWIEGRGEGKTCMLIRATDGRGIGGNWREERWNRGTERGIRGRAKEVKKR